MAGAIKKTTALTGLAVARTPHHSLEAIYRKIIGCLNQMPETAAYRKHTQAIVNQRLALVNTEENVAKLEQKINGGQVEELILQAENELILARKMLTWKPWEPLIKSPPKNQWKWPI